MFNRSWDLLIKKYGAPSFVETLITTISFFPIVMRSQMLYGTQYLPLLFIEKYNVVGHLAFSLESLIPLHRTLEESLTHRIQRFPRNRMQGQVAKIDFLSRERLPWDPGRN